MFDADVSAGVCRLALPEGRWLSTGWNGGYRDSDAAYNVTVPEPFERQDLDAFAARRRREAGYDSPGPTCFTGVDMSHARLARAEGVVVCATAGVSNPATLPLVGEHGAVPGSHDRSTAATDDEPPVGTINLLVGSNTHLSAGGLASLLATATEAKTATVKRVTGFTGTTSDAVVVGCPRGGKAGNYAGSATAVGDATRRCVRDAIVASLTSRYPEGNWPQSVSAAKHGVRTTGPTTVEDPN